MLLRGENDRDPMDLEERRDMITFPLPAQKALGHVTSRSESENMGFFVVYYAEDCHMNSLQIVMRSARSAPLADLRFLTTWMIPLQLRMCFKLDTVR